jgi:hypothetical protein
MRPLSPTDCVSPAIARTRLILFRPFRFGRTWKLSATAYVARGGTIFLPFPLIYLAFLPVILKHHGQAMALFAACGILVATALFVWIFMLCSRLQFAHFDIVLNRGQFVAPAWRKYKESSRNWTYVKLVFGLVVTLITAVPLALYLKRVLPLFTITPGQPPPPGFVASLFAIYGIFFLCFGTFYLIVAICADFIVPSIALEGTTIQEAFRRMWLLFRGEPGASVGYCFFKVLLGVGGYAAMMIAFEMVLLLVMVIVGGLAVGIGFLLHNAHVPSPVLIGLATLVGIAFYIFILWAVTIAVGSLFTFLEAYTLYFLAGRYPMLGDLLERSTPHPAVLAYAPPPPQWQQASYPPPPTYPPPPMYPPSEDAPTLPEPPVDLSE